MTFSGQVPHFFLHHQAHQCQPGFAHEMADPFLQQSDDLGHRKDHLQVGVFFAGQLSKLLHRSLLVDLISFLHSDSLLFSWQKKTTSVIMTAVESRYFLRINGHPPRNGLCGSFSDRSSGLLGNLLHMCDAQLTIKTRM